MRKIPYLCECVIGAKGYLDISCSGYEIFKSIILRRQSKWLVWKMNWTRVT